MNLLKKHLFPLFLIGSLFLTTDRAFSEEIIRLANGEWPPYTSKKLDHYGVYSRIVSEAFALEGVKVEYQFFPWVRSYLNAVAGTSDGSLTWAPTAEKQEEVLFSDPVVEHKKVFFHLKNFAFDWSKIEDLTSIRVGATKSYTYSDEFDVAVARGMINVEYVTADIQNLKKIFGGRLDVFPSDIIVGYDLLKNNFSPEQASLITHHPKSIQVTHTSLILTRKNPEKSQRLLKLFNSGLRKLRASGRYDELLEAYQSPE